MKCSTCRHFDWENYDSPTDCPYVYECARLGDVYEANNHGKEETSC